MSNEFDRFVTAVKGIVMEPAHTLAPDGDVPTCAFMEVDEEAIVALPIPSEIAAMAGELVGEAMGAIMQAISATRFAHVFTAYVTELPTQRRSEVVMVVAFDGDEGTQTWMNELTRFDDKAPMFGGWYSYDGEVAGAILDGLRGAL